ncbi:MAG: dihydroorotate dehydrogenase [Candidatus Cloacimonadota bacterium]|jgi:dihydroorotate dehydrogenase (NAD+) catalytic subunit|nr:dihydroorotate dehydrogenase [Candidatus Cloacimonas sp.]MDI9572562.1 dihydroorotate dehydrogenase [Candidatus Cloacimonadota bacterium]HNZ88602.1 dihydroorotate dehydrogenase [Candidatus Cloacimonas acidaminovorans]NLM90098.1 dihydroorotate dehydrogenase [Candidatus Cloacimonadota bacterium]HPI42675.1 dihydroorotate dehydrogenase [Candidatus Cloacimonas acidaminovorans]
MEQILNPLQTSLGRLKVNSPVTVASGTFALENLDFIAQEHLGAYVCKTITRYPKKGNPPPRLYETEAGLLNSIGLQNPGLDKFIAEDLPVLRETLTVPLIVSFSGSSLTEFTQMLECLEKQEGISGYEVNVSCPNVENEGIAFGIDPDVVNKLCALLSPLTEREFIVKLSPNVTDIAVIAKAAEEGGATAISLINTIWGMAIDYCNGKSRIKKGIGGYSGIGIKPLALALTYRAAQAVKIPVIAMGGIYNWQDALEFFWAGASMIALGTANFIDPLAVDKVYEGLSSFCLEKQLNLKDIVGKVNK